MLTKAASWGATAYAKYDLENNSSISHFLNFSFSHFLKIMAIFKCPECGHIVSDKAPHCPGCGLEITPELLANEKDNAKKEPVVAEPVVAEPVVEQPVVVEPVVESYPMEVPAATHYPQQKPIQQQQKKNSHTALFISLLVAAIICGLMLYFYQKASDNNEQQDYLVAMKSQNPLTLQSYIDTYQHSAPAAHLDDIRSRLEQLRAMGEEWTNTLVANSRQQYEAYLQAHPDTPHKALIQNKIDSLDWEHAKNLDNVEGYDNYLEQHPSGRYVTNAESAIKKMRLTLIQPEEKQNAQTVVKRFFQAVNANDKTHLIASVTPVMSSLLGEAGAGSDKVVEFMEKMYKEDVTNLNWYLDPITAIEKEEIGTGEYQYKIQMPARLRVARGNDVTETRYRINATVSPDSKVSALNLVKLSE